MELRRAPDDPNTGWTHTMVSEHFVVHMGVYRVFYGWRVRAGYVLDTGGCSLDWCAGGRWQDVERLYSLCAAILSRRNEDGDVFAGIPRFSRVKPFYKDDDFVRSVGELAGEGFELLNLEIVR